MSILFRCFVVMSLVASFGGAQPSSAVAGAITLASSGYQVPPAALNVAPGQLIVLHVYGIATTIPSNITAVPSSSGYPTVLDGISVDLIQGTNATATALGLRAAYQTNCLQPCSAVTGITLQIPFALESDFLAKGDPAPYLRISENGKSVGAVSLRPVSDNIHVLNTCDDTQVYISAADSVPQDICAPAVMVGGALNSLYNLAHAGNELAVWVYGMGAITPQAPGCCASPSRCRPSSSISITAPTHPLRR